MKVLVVGGGGREHVLAWKLKQSAHVSRLYCAPGNGGIAEIATCVPIGAMEIDKMVSFARDEAMDLVVVAPDDPLAAGMVDAMRAAGIRAFGPTAAAARLEASKVFSKTLMKKYAIPTAAYEVFEDMQPALVYLQKCAYPAVIKADGLALGKGVIIAQTREEAEKAVVMMMQEGAFGAAGSRILIEEYLTGPEMTVLAFADGKTVLPMVTSRDHKRICDDDKGPNTGGMGTISPAGHGEKWLGWMREHVFVPTIDAMACEGCPFQGVIYFGMMITPNGPRVIEYNARFGDPEAQVVLPRLKNDLLDVLEATIDGTLDGIELQWDDRAAVCVVLASKGYPGQVEADKKIEGLPEAAAMPDTMVFHAGTKRGDDGVYSSGGRVLGVTALGDSLADAREKAYAAAEKISFDGMQMRRDIGLR